MGNGGMRNWDWKSTTSFARESDFFFFFTPGEKAGSFILLLA